MPGTSPGAGPRRLDRPTARARITDAGLLDLQTALDTTVVVLRLRFGTRHTHVALRGQPFRRQSIALSSDLMTREWLLDRIGPSSYFPDIDRGLGVLIRDRNEHPDPDVRTNRDKESLLRSAMRLPLRDEQSQLIGVVVVGSEEPNVFAEDDLEELRDLAALISVFVRRGDLLTRLERQNAVLMATADILNEVPAAGTLTEVYDNIAARIRRMFGADHCALASVAADILDPPGFSSRIMTRSELPRSFTREDLAAFAHAARGEAVHFRDLQGVPLNPTTRLAADYGLRSLIRAPLAMPAGQVGIVTVGSCEPDFFLDDDPGRLMDVCRPLGVALERADLVAEISRGAAVRTAQARVLAALTPDATFETVAGVYVEEARELFGATHAVVTRLAGDTGQVIALSSDHIRTDDLVLPPPGVPTGVSHFQTLQAGHAIVLDLATIERGPVEEAAYAHGLRSIMRAPIPDTDGAFGGIIAVGSATPDAFSRQDLEQLQTLSQAASLVMQRVGLLQAARDQAARTRGLQRLLSELHTTADPHEIATAFAGELRGLLGATVVAVLQANTETGLCLPLAVVTEDRRPGSLPFAAGPVPREASGPLDADAIPGVRTFLTAAGCSDGFATRLEGSDGLMGLIIAGAARPGILSPQARDLMTDVALSLAMLLDRSRLLTSLREQSDRTQAMLELVAALGARERAEDIARPVASALRLMYRADVCAVVPEGPAGFEIAGQDAGPGIPPIAFEATPDAMDTSLSSLRNSARLVADTDRVRIPLSPLAAAARGRGMRSAIELLLETGESRCIVLLASLEPRRFTEADVRELRQTARPLGVAIAHSQGRREAALRARRLEHTNRVLSTLTAGGDPRAVAAALLPACRELFNAGLAFVAWCNQDTGELDLLAIDSQIIDVAKVPRSLPGDSYAAEAVRAFRQPQLVGDARHEPYYSAFHPKMIENGYYSVLRVPLMVRGEPHGMVALWGRGAGAFGQDDLDLLTALAGPLAIALGSATAQESLAENELKYRSLVAQAEEMIFLADAQTLRILEANGHAARLLGYDPETLATMDVPALFAEPGERLAQLFRFSNVADRLQLGERLFRRADGSTFTVDIVGSTVTFGRRDALLLLARDVSERQQLQRQLMQAQKMESLGAMAGNVAHDFNNLLTAILGFAGILRLSAALNSEDRENVALIESAAARAADLSGRLLSFARGGLVTFGPVDLAAAVRDTLRLAEPTLAGIRVQADLPPDVFIEGDANQVEQAVFNVVLNARDAMDGAGELRLAVWGDRDGAHIRIADTGQGMDDETRLRIFEPFFTTKPPGSGTGLGMAITYGVVQGHGGRIDVQSAPGHGTTFTLTFPRLAPPSEPRASQSEPRA
ncbi:MAG: GAF domain-containing protein [Dehalococcoidia bacterium]|nr:GAF domain-containing protein [Dehalococcoidia bacterium]